MAADVPALQIGNLFQDDSLVADLFEDDRMIRCRVCNAEAHFSVENVAKQIPADFTAPAGFQFRTGIVGTFA